MSVPDPFLLGLFREELEMHGAVLTDGLLRLENGSTGKVDIEPLMRAAHSIKGAARVVGLDPLVTVAHEMEEVLVAAGEGRVMMDPSCVDQLLGALDWIQSVVSVPDEAIAKGMEDCAAEAEVWVDTLKAQLATKPESASIVSSQEDAPEEEAPNPNPQDLCVPEVEQGTMPVEDATAAVRVSAELLSRILGYASDLLLEARRLERVAEDWVEIKKIPRRLSAETLLGREQIASLTRQMDRHDLQLNERSGRISFLADQLHNLALRGRMRPFSEGVGGFPRMVRDLARELGKSVRFEILGQSTLVDRDILSRLDAPLNHLLRNALDHGIEMPDVRVAKGKLSEGRLKLEARHRSGRLIVTLTDDGAGIQVEALRNKIVERGLVTLEMASSLNEAELFDFLFLPGLSTKSSVTEISGRGVGLDVVQSMVHACGGSLRVLSEEGLGTTFEIQLPVTRSVIRTLEVEVDRQRFAIPLAGIQRAERRSACEVTWSNGLPFISSKPHHIAILSLRSVLGYPDDPPSEDLHTLVVIGSEDRQFALEVDRFVGESDLVVRPLDPRLGKIQNVSAAALDEEGHPVLILDVGDLIRSSDRQASLALRRRRAGEVEKQARRRILVVDDSVTVREVERKLLENAGYEVEMAVDGMEGWNLLTSRAYDLLVSDVDMPRMNGIELVKKVRKDRRLESLPVIIVSYKDREEDRLKGMDAGADYYLTKSSFHDQGLTEAVATLLGTGREG